MFVLKFVITALTISTCIAATAIAEESDFKEFCIRKSSEMNNPDPERFCTCVAEKAETNATIEIDLRATSDTTSPEEVMASVSETTQEALQACEPDDGEI